MIQTDSALSDAKMSTESNINTTRISFLARMALLLNSSLDTRRVIAIALQHIQDILEAEGATIFSLEAGSSEITFWALPRADQALLNKRLPVGKGIVGWVIENREALHVKDVKNDPRFFGAFDEKGGFITKEIICVPLIARGNNLLGALQVLNPLKREHFADDDLHFVEQCAQQLSMALENARLYEALKEQNAKLETLGKRKSEIASIISHEFRTPLNIIRTAADLIVSAVEEQKNMDKEISDALFRGVDRLSKIVSEITNLSLVERQALSIEAGEIKASALIQDVAEQFRLIAQERELNLSYDTHECSSTIQGDKGLLAIVLCNLMANAIRFTPNGGSFNITCQAKTGMVEFSVSDTGIGIAEEEVPLIFEKFYEVVPAANHSSGNYSFKSCGLGLGLATAASILAAHGTKLRVESKLGSGSRFYFSLPEA